MSKINKYNEFLNFKKLYEASSLDSPNPVGLYGRDNTDTYFANVKGNLAGGENTLVGAAVLKFIGFLKRKGAQLYLSTVLVPQLGKIYMNGILRYAIKKGITNFPEKTLFGIQKVVNEEYVEVTDKVSFTKDKLVGINAFVVGATISTKSGVKIENGDYILNVDGKHFKIENSIITYIGEDIQDETPQTETPQTETPQTETPQTETTETYEIKIEDDIEPDIKESIISLKKLFDSIKGVTKDGGLSEENKTKLNEWVTKLNKSIDDINKLGLSEIKKDLDSDPTSIKRLELEHDYKVYNDSLNYLTKIRDIISKYLKDKSEVKSVEPLIKKESYVHKSMDSFLLESNDTGMINDVTNGSEDGLKPINAPVNKISPHGKTQAFGDRFGDELQKLNGRVIDLNNEDFYKNFEDPKVKKEVSDEVLTDISGLNRIQLSAERIISDNKKLDFDWKKMVNRVLSLYSKFMVTDLVNPYKIIANTVSTGGVKPTADISEVDDIMGLSTAMDCKLFKDSVSDLGESDDMKNNIYTINKLSFKGGKINIGYKNYLLKTVSDKSSGYNIFKVLGTIDMNKIDKNFTEKDFTTVITKDLGQLNPTKMIDVTGRKLFGIYIINTKKTNFIFGKNSVSIIYLFSNKTKFSEINWTTPSDYSFLISDTHNKKEVELTTLSAAISGFEQNYKVEMIMDEKIKIKVKKSTPFITSLGNLNDIFKTQPTVLSLFDTFKNFILK